MLRKLFLFLPVLFFVACSTSTKKEEVTGIFIENQLADFIANNPDWTKDEATEEVITDKFKRQAIKWSNEVNFLNDMPLQLKRVIDTLENGQAVKMAHFYAYSDPKRASNGLLNSFNLHIKGIISEEQANALIIDQKYILTGNLQRQGKRADVKFIKVSDFRGYDLGSYTFLISTVKPL